MQAVRLVVAYDGTAFAGWQRQPGQRTVQGVLEEAVSAIEGAPVSVRGASRTDSGVHAHGQVVAFDAARSLPPLGWVRGLNGKLPQDVAVVSAAPCEVGYTPRFDARGKTYRYLLHLDAVRDPLLAHRAWHLGPRRAKPHDGERAGASDWLDLDAMDAAAARLVGEHDFRAFRASQDGRESTIRTLSRVEVRRGWAGREDLLAIEVRGTAFMQHMVRILAGTLVDVGRLRMTPDDVAALLREDADRSGAGETAPPWGLYLVQVELGRASAPAD